MAETSHSRSRRVALAGLILQILAALAAFALGRGLASGALDMLALYIAGGIPIWFVTLLVFRQHELAALEAMDLEELRREKQATGGGEAIFSEDGSGGLGFMVAKSRLNWMRRWLVPAFGLIVSAYLIVAGAGFWIAQTRREVAPWETLRSAEIGMVLAALVMLFLFFFSRYASGMAKVPGWQLLRGGATYMLGNAVATLAVIVGLGAYKQDLTSWEHAIAFAIPVVMQVLGVEMLINFLLDVYRPRSPGTEPRACFDSRLLGMIAEPGGIAHSLAEAVNYQFGFEVSQTWFYQLMQRTLIKLIVFGVAAVWLLSCVVVVYPYERAIIERFGRQVNAEHPWGPGLYLKWPAPIEIAQKYNTDQLHEFYVGYRDFDQPAREDEEKSDEPVVELWSDRKHGGRDHFDFVIPPSPPSLGEQPAAEQQHIAAARQVDAAEEEKRRAAQHLVRAVAVVQYKIDPAKLVDFTRHLKDSHAALHKLAWGEMAQFVGSAHIDQLMGELRESGGEMLRQRIAKQAEELKLGVDIIYVGILQVHPTKEVAEAFRRVVTAQQEKIGEIRKARVTENGLLSRVAGDKRRALALAYAIDKVQANELRLSELERRLVDQNPALPADSADLQTLRPYLLARLDAEWQLELERQKLERIREDFALGLGGSLRDLAEAEQAVQAWAQTFEEADEVWQRAVQPLRTELSRKLEAAVVEAWLGRLDAQVALEFWNKQLEENLAGLEGEAAAILARARARRWELEMRAAGEVALLQNERFAYRAAPAIYRTRSYLHVWVNGIEKARKYFLAFEPNGRKVHIRYEVQEQAQPGLTDIPTNLGQQ